ncbi:hypothetical protein AX16_003442 [Volvariella volvacea WC 439]|nr:hypothetical protein AX16_003442 [Volvariella volvacea WC 439]
MLIRLQALSALLGLSLVARAQDTNQIPTYPVDDPAAPASPASGDGNAPSSPGYSTPPPIPAPSPITGGTGFSSAVPVTSYTFSPFPTPSPSPIPGVFPESDPNQPPPPESLLVPDFGPAWARAYKKAQEKIASFTLEQKVNVTTGVGWMNGRCVGNIPPVGDWPGLCLEDAPLGVRFADYVTAFPAAINAAATFNRRLIRQRGLLIGREHRVKGVHIALGPMTNLARVAQGGRNWEGFGGDPWLSGEAVYETVLGMQEAGVGACVKHLIANEQEFKRTRSSSDIDDRTMHEVYAHPFLRGVMAGAVSMMCSYNLVNNTYACENNKVMNDIVKREYGFQGYILSDWQATHSTISAITGLDMTMPGDVYFGSGTTYFGPNLVAYVQNGTIPESRIDDMATRILAAWYLLQQDSSSFPPVNFDAFRPDDDDLNDHVDTQEDHYKLVRIMGAASTVLLKNVNNTLPLGRRNIHSEPHQLHIHTLDRRGGLGVYWDDDYGRQLQTPLGSGSGSGRTGGRGKKLRSIVVVGRDAGPGRVGPNGFADHGGSDGSLAMGWGSGTANFTYLVTPLEAIQRRARRDRTSVSWILDDWDLPRVGNVVRKKDAAIVFINSNSGEEYINVDGNGGDRKNLTAWNNGDELVLKVASENNNTIVVVHTVGALLVERWIDHPNVTAVLWAGLPGQESGNSITDILYGDWNPSARLPYTIAKRAEDYSAGLVTLGGDILAIPYTEELNIDYRHFDANNIEPRFEFGFGLSYTKFEYSKLKVSRIQGACEEDRRLIENWQRGEATPIAQGSSAALWLHQPAFNISFTVKNVGDYYGGEIPQLYIHMPSYTNEPPKLLRGFTDVSLNPGEKKVVTMTLSRYDLSIWDVEKQGWRRPVPPSSGTIADAVRGHGTRQANDSELEVVEDKVMIGVLIGASSRDVRLRGEIEL